MLGNINSTKLKTKLKVNSNSFDVYFEKKYIIDASLVPNPNKVIGKLEINIDRGI